MTLSSFSPAGGHEARAVLLNRIFVAESGSAAKEIERQTITGDGQQHEIHSSKHWPSSLAPAVARAQAEIGDG